MSIVIIDYGSGNLRSAAKAVERVAGGRPVAIVDAPAALKSASHIVLPGVGAFGDCMKGLAALPGMAAALEKEVLEQKKPLLGICVGMQMLFEKGHEHGEHQGLGWLKGEVVPLIPSPRRGEAGRGASLVKQSSSKQECPHPNPPPMGEGILKIPHMGWNELHIEKEHPLMRGIETGAHAYFVHSFHAACKEASAVIATAQYGQTIAAVVGQGHIMGTQFHPEKSQETGLQLLRNFINL